jgi:copper chaperone CopZ
MGQESNEDGFSIEEEWNDVQKRLKKVPYQMKLEIKEVLRQLPFPNTTVLSPPPRKVLTKEAKKKVDIARSRAKGID